MTTITVALVYGMLVWWLGTSLVLLLGRLPARLDGALRLGVATCFGLATGLLVVVQRDSGVHATYAAFSLAIVSWGALELAYFRGWMTGPRNLPCPEPATTVQRFKAGVLTSLHHELAVITTAVLLLASSGSGEQNTGTATFVLLWLMRWSAKLNLFLGVRNFSTHMLPEPMRYLDSYVRRASMNPLFPVSIGLAGAVLASLLMQATALGANATTVAHHMLLGTLLGLAIVEHVLLMAPISDRRLWNWALPGDSRR